MIKVQVNHPNAQKLQGMYCSRFSFCGVGTAPGSEDKLDLLMNAHFQLKHR